ncbi:2Fe-2S iron-sulfur cluster-binding protein [Salinigranum sp. GCM10025319]|uniref:2Fe-2S iron-sulfur cluster-binding protein n=1 Tax=Salinigranum sp. GCM10025319 TaxID=3252687 RepID=UPI00360AC658
MPTVSFRGREIDCEAGATLREVLLDAEETPHNGRSRLLNCRGHGSCGTCAVVVDGSILEPTRRERLRLSFPPHDADSGLRLACQTLVLGDVVVEKFDGFWGQDVDDSARSDPADD